MRTLQHISARFFAVIVFASLNFGLVPAAPLVIIGNDEKLLWDDDGKRVLFPAGMDSVMILDLADPENPKIVANLPLKNSVVGPPVNVAIDPTNTIALVADQSMSQRMAILSRWHPITRSMLSISRPTRPSSPEP